MGLLRRSGGIIGACLLRSNKSCLSQLNVVQPRIDKLLSPTPLAHARISRRRVPRHQADLPFDYNLERVIDDFLLLAVFVGNNFLPNLPDLHIHANGLERLFDVYKKILPSLGQCMLCGQPPHQTSLLTCHSRCRWASQGEWDYQHSMLTDSVR